MLLEPTAPPASPSVVAVAAVAWDAGFVVLVVSACVEVPSLLGGSPEQATRVPNAIANARMHHPP